MKSKVLFVVHFFLRMFSSAAHAKVLCHVIVLVEVRAWQPHVATIDINSDVRPRRSHLVPDTMGCPKHEHRVKGEVGQDQND